MPTDPFAAYLAEVERDVRAGQATEHTYRPALKRLLEAFDPGVTATNEPKRVACGAPDYLISRPGRHGLLTVGYIEAKDIGRLTADVERSDQLHRYLGSLRNLILTDYLEFRWYVDGTARRGAPGHLRAPPRPRPGRRTRRQPAAHAFCATRPPPSAVRTSSPCAWPASPTSSAISSSRPSSRTRPPTCCAAGAAFADVLIADLDQPEKVGEFADMYAQTIAYGLFSARVMDTTPGFRRQEAQRLSRAPTPSCASSSRHRRDADGRRALRALRGRPGALFEQADMDAVLDDFGRRTGQEDPVVHFYETFLAAYDPKLRESRGVYYTPEPVVSYIVRSVDHLLRTRFGCRDGLADTSTVTIANPDPGVTVKGTTVPRKTARSHRVLVLDPACGTGTFLYAIVDHIRSQFMAQGNAGMWDGYVREHLLPRLFGFELLMAPYAVAHFKLGLQLAGRDLPEAQRAAWAYDFASDERLGVYLTNTLEGPHEHTGLPLFTQFIADEADAANRVKRDLPIMVVIGNPPYSGHSANKGEWISQLVRDYYEVDGHPLGERNPSGCRTTT